MIEANKEKLLYQSQQHLFILNFTHSNNINNMTNKGLANSDQ